MNAIHCYLLGSQDCIEDAEPFNTQGEALRSFRRTAEELAGYGQQHEASIHYAKTLDDLHEYPDLVLSLGKYGGLKMEKT